MSAVRASYMYQVTHPLKYIIFKATVHSAMGTSGRRCSSSRSPGWQCPAPLLTPREPAPPEPVSQQQSLGSPFPLSAASVGAISLEFYLREMGILPSYASILHLERPRRQDRKLTSGRKGPSTVLPTSVTRMLHTDLSCYDTLVLLCRENIHRLVLCVL